MSDSVNVMFKDQSDKRKYRRDEDRLFNQVRGRGAEAEEEEEMRG
jgi:hypothetical protein